MALTVGIIGLPLSGKTTLFNALTRAGAEISGYPTSTVQANRAVVQVHVVSGLNQYVARIPAADQNQVQYLYQQVNYVRSLAAM